MVKEFKCMQCGYESDDEIDFMRAVNADLLDSICNDCAEKIIGSKEFNSKKELQAIFDKELLGEKRKHFIEKMGKLTGDEDEKTIK